MTRDEILEAHAAGKSGQEIVALVLAEGYTDEAGAAEWVDYVLNGGDVQPPLEQPDSMG